MQDLLDLLLGVGHRRDDEQPVEQVDRDAVRGLVVGAADASDAAVGGDDEHGRQVRLERAVEVREALDVEHVHLVDEEHAWHDLGFPLFPPLRHFRVDLLAHLWLDLACIAREESEEALLPRVDHVNLMQRDDMHHLLALLQLSLRALHELGIRPHGIIVAGPGEGASKDRDASGRLVNRDHVPCLRLLFGERVDHLLAQIIYRLHLRRLQGQLARLSTGGSSRGRPVDLNLDDFPLDDLCLLLDAHANRPAERLCERLCLVHLQREDLGRGDRGERSVRAESLRHAHCDGSLPRTRLPRDEDRPPGDVPFLDHAEDDARCLPCVRLPDHPLGDHARLERVIEPKAADVRVRADPLDARDVLHLLHLHSGRGHCCSRGE
mmetsp:Transcript_42728/g.106338  ORF Transcript_42728/g.106338 Transcript_42728/m.106338 type:complete len:379 (-) Transcript_42728:89-1225(-)